MALGVKRDTPGAIPHQRSDRFGVFFVTASGRCNMKRRLPVLVPHIYTRPSSEEHLDHRELVLGDGCMQGTSIAWARSIQARPVLDHNFHDAYVPSLSGQAQSGSLKSPPKVGLSTGSKKSFHYGGAAIFRRSDVKSRISVRCLVRVRSMPQEGGCRFG